MRRVAICLICWLGSIAAQTGPFRVQTKIVQVPVSVTDKNGRNLDGLAASDFAVLDDGVERKITLDDFDTGLPPISLAIVVETSGISTPALAKIRRIGSMIQPLVIGAQGTAAVVVFNREIKWLQDFTSDDAEIQDALESLKAGSGMDQARMLDAIAEVADRMKQRKGRKVLLLISESRDRGSETTFQQAMEAVQRQGIEVFGAHYSAYATTSTAKPKDLPDLSSSPTIPIDPSDEPECFCTVQIAPMFFELARLGKTNAIQALTLATGGSDYPWEREQGVDNAIEKLGMEVHSQYILSFSQHESATGMHKIEVSLPSRGDLRVRSRRVYWADQTGQADHISTADSDR
jgi:VWFA-related protein